MKTADLTTSVDIFRFEDIRSLIVSLCEAMELSQRQLATRSKIHPSYFSRVMQNKASFSQEQIFLVAEQFQLSMQQLEFINLLGDIDRSNNFKHQQFLLNKVQEVRKKNLSLISRLKSQNPIFHQSEESLRTYYEDASTALVHMALIIPGLRQNREMLKQYLGISQKILHVELQKLASLGIIAIDEQGTLEVLKEWVHLPEDSPYSRKNHLNWRLRTVSKLMASDFTEGYNFSAVFSVNDSAKEKIIELFKDFSFKTSQVVKNCKNEDRVCHIGFDLH